MTPPGGRSKRVPHGESAWSHAVAAGAASQGGINDWPAGWNPIPVCSHPSGSGAAAL